MRAAAGLAVAALATACATIGSQGGGDVDLPSSGVGPFRKLGAEEMLGVAPYVVDDRSAQYRQPAALPLAGAAGGEVALYFVGGDAGRGHLYRTRATDARSFYGAPLDSGHAPKEVLAPDAGWEGSGLTTPSVVARDGGEVWLYYGTESGAVGLARSGDGGLTFAKEPAPVLEGARSPSVARQPSGAFVMLFVTGGGSIAEATSADGRAWTRAGVVLSPSAPVDPASLAPGERPPFDVARLDFPLVAPRETPAGQVQVRVLYTGYDASGVSAVGFAARYGEASAPLSRNPTPVLSLGAHEGRAALFEWSRGSMLYFDLDESGTSGEVHRAIGAALAPASETLATPDGTYADHP